MGVVDYKVCRTCGKSKPLSKFHPHSGYRDGRSVSCGRCTYEKYGKNYVKVYLTINRFDKTKSLAELFNSMIVTKVRQLLDRLHESGRLTDTEFLELLDQLRYEGIFDANRPTRRTSGSTTDSHSG